MFAFYLTSKFFLKILMLCTSLYTGRSAKTASVSEIFWQQSNSAAGKCRSFSVQESSASDAWSWRWTFSSVSKFLLSWCLSMVNNSICFHSQGAEQGWLHFTRSAMPSGPWRCIGPRCGVSHQICSFSFHLWWSCWAGHCTSWRRQPSHSKKHVQ